MKRIAAAFLLYFLLAPSAFSNDLDKALEEMKNFWKGVDSFTCDFEQTRRAALFEGDMISTGSLAYKKPETIVLRYDRPDDSVISIKPGLITMYYPSLKEAQVIHFDEDNPLSNTIPILIGTADEIDRLKKAYTISYGSEKGLVVFTFIPQIKNNLKNVEKYVIKLTTRYMPVETTIYQLGGDTTVMRFTNQKINPPLDEGSLKVPLPPDTRIQEMGGGR